jgi:hypothetical protein
MVCCDSLFAVAHNLLFQRSICSLLLLILARGCVLYIVHNSVVESSVVADRYVVPHTFVVVQDTFRLTPLLGA